MTSKLPSTSVPQANIEAYCLLYELEVCLRELIIEVLERCEGAQWYKRRLPGDVLAKYKDGRAKDRTQKWVQFVHSHPVYYIDFPDLEKVICREDNWQQSFSSIFGSKPALASLKVIEPIRNKVAHNRRVTQGDLAVLTGSHTQVMTALGETRIAQLLQRAGRADDLPSAFADLLTEGRACIQSINALDVLPARPTALSIVRQWWFDTDYLGVDILAVSSFLTLLDEYDALPRVRGSGHHIEIWVKRSHCAELFDGFRVRMETLLALCGAR